VPPFLKEPFLISSFGYAFGVTGFGEHQIYLSVCPGLLDKKIIIPTHYVMMRTKSVDLAETGFGIS
jgi:hypothetical protein